jgi:iron(III) transport system substrate-binding protein
MRSDAEGSLLRGPISRRALLRGTLAAAVGPALLGCQAASEARTPPDAAAGAGASAPAPPAGSPPAAQWDELVQAARREGSLVLAGPPTPAVRTEVPAAFKRQYGIEIEYLGGRTSDLWPRLDAERAAGQYTVDVLITGAAGFYNEAYPKKMLAALPPVLVLPEATDPTKWQAGRVWFMDPDQQYILRLSNQITFIVAVNTEYVPAEELGTWHDLLKPALRGKISADDPTVAGAGWNRAIYLSRNLGEDYVRALYRDQQVAVSRDERQQADWLARGQHPIALGLGTNDILNLRAEGFPIAVVLADRPEAPGMVTAGFGMMAMLEPAPHPAAARVFVNWVASREGSEVYNRAQVNASVRTDVDNAWMPDFALPRPGVDYFDGYAWDWVTATRGPDDLEQMRRLVGRGTS